ncbi:MAG: PfkB family carbohydrate kinase [Candidatus Nitrosocaldus sp.]|nr:PfkB family carbohydrate kinase [Candidatus Nitrosocaldus sp.]
MAVMELVAGAINWDTTVFIDEFPAPGEEVRARKVISVPGGKGANTAVASSRILGRGKVGLIGALGDDRIADEQIRILEEEGIDTSCVKRFADASGQAYILVDAKGENMILTYKAVNDMLKPEMLVEQSLRDAVDGARILVVIDPPLEFALALMESARSGAGVDHGMGKTIVWMPALLTRLGFDALRVGMERVDYLVMNESECLNLSQAGDVMQGFKALARLGKRMVLTMGSQGCLFHWDGKTVHIPTVDLKAIGLNVVSTVGAGDAFLGAFTALLLKGYGEIEALFMANLAAALKVSREETRASPYYDELMRYMGDERVERFYTGIRVL